jgi:carboxyl-terminal processing protease
MKKQMFIVALAFAMSAPVAWAQPDKAGATQLKPIAAQAQAALWASKVLSRHHYKAMPLDDAMSEKIFDRYFKTLDSEKLYFLQSDIDQFDVVRNKLDDAINNENLTLPFAVYNVYQQRFNERMAYARELLKGKFDFTTDETFQLDREKAAWPKNDDEARDLWRRRVKNDWLRLKLAGKEDKAIRETLDKRYDNYVTRMRKLNNEDVFQMFMNAYAMSIEPHTNYLGPRSAENFDIAMRLSLEGIGAVLQSRDEYTVIREVVPGSPAALSGWPRAIPRPSPKCSAGASTTWCSWCAAPRIRWCASTCCRPIPAPMASTCRYRWCARKSAWRSSRPRSRSLKCAKAASSAGSG